MRKKKVVNELVNSQKLSYWLKHKQNVLFEGKHGVGKTSIILQSFKDAGLRYAYFSGATMDPFIDFIGIPVKVHGKHGDSIELIRPKHIEDLNVQAIFIDEFNRTHKKVRNAVMELLQFKTINGKPISKDLRVVWAAINPDNANGENDYDTDHLDPAQKDRFQIQVKIPYVCSLSYFTEKFGDKLAEKSIRWWNNLEDKVKDKISPRRMEYALSLYLNKGDMRDVLPAEANVTQLVNLLGHKGEHLDSVLKKKKEDIQKFFANENNYELFHQDVLKIRKYRTMLQYFPSEKISSLVSSSGAARFIVNRQLKTKEAKTIYYPILCEIALASASKFIARWANKLIKKHKLAPKPPKQTKQTKVKSTYLPVKIPKSKTTKSVLLSYLFSTRGGKVDFTTIQTGISGLLSRHVSTGKLQRELLGAASWFQKRGYELIGKNSTYQLAPITATDESDDEVL